MSGFFAVLDLFPGWRELFSAGKEACFLGAEASSLRGDGNNCWCHVRDAVLRVCTQGIQGGMYTGRHTYQGIQGGIHTGRLPTRVYRVAYTPGRL